MLIMYLASYLAIYLKLYHIFVPATDLQFSLLTEFHIDAHQKIQVMSCQANG